MSEWLDHEPDPDYEAQYDHRPGGQMPTKFKVLEVVHVHKWTNDYGDNFDFNLMVEDDRGETGEIQITAKKDNAYRTGTEFWAENKHQQHKGVPKWKKVQPPDTAPASRQSGMQSSGNAPSSHPAPPRKAIPYEQAGQLIKRLLDDYGQVPQAFAAIFEAIIDGRVESPLKAKTVIRYFGRDMETAGIEQEQFDRIDQLCARLDKVQTKALLISNCGVQSRLELTPEKADTYEAALKAAVAMLDENPPPADEDRLPF